MIIRAVTKAYFMLYASIFLNFGYDQYFILSLFKFLLEKKILFKDLKRALTVFRLYFI